MGNLQRTEFDQSICAALVTISWVTDRGNLLIFHHPTAQLLRHGSRIDDTDQNLKAEYMIIWLVLNHGKKIFTNCVLKLVLIEASFLFQQNVCFNFLINFSES